MFYFLSKVLSYFLTPAGFITFILLAALLIGNPVYRRRLFILLFVSWFFAGNSFLSNELARWWEFPPATLSAVRQPRVGIILTGGMMQSDVPPFDRILLGPSADRMGQAFLLYRSGQIQKILISGGADPIDGRRVANEARLTAAFLVKAGVRPEDIVLENKSRNTEENARFSAPVLKSRFADYDYVLVTSAFHMRRAVGCFRQQQVKVSPYPADFIARQRRFAPDVLFLPAESSLWDNWKLFHEFFGYAVYRAMGYL